MPNLSFSVAQESSMQNLFNLGFKSSGLPINSSVIGPYNNFDSRFHFQQSILNLSAIRQYQAGRVDISIADWQEKLARQQVATATTIAYMNDLRAGLAVAAAQANLDLAQTLQKLASDQRDAGIATGVDLARAQTRVAQEQVSLAQAQTNAEQARLQLMRVIGLPMDKQLILTDALKFSADELPSIDAALAIAEQNRVEIHVAQEQVKFQDYNQKAAHAELMPSLDFVADYGVGGSTPVEAALPTRSYGVRLNLPIFNGGLTRGRIAVAKSRKHQAEMQLDDLRAQVEEDVRLAMKTLSTTDAQERAAEQALALAERELKMASDRFAAGVGDNVEVINAQTALANARDARVAALAQYNAARVNLCAALGQIESFHW
jgi:outer membrane protein TolC